MTNVLLVIHLVLCLGLIVLVLIQRSEGGALSGLGGGGGGGMSGFMTGRSASTLLTRATALLAGGFMLTSLLLSLIANADRSGGSLLDEGTAPAGIEQPAAPKAAEPGAPLAE